jgi:hypothetical protein
MARRKPIYQAVPLASIQRRRHHRQILGIVLAITVVATVIYAFAATAILRDAPVHAGAIVPRPTATGTATAAPGTDTAQGDTTTAPADPPAPGSADP